MGKVKDNWLSLLCLGVLILIVGVGLMVKFGVERAIAEEIEAKFPDRGVPRINITLNDVTLEEINAGSKDVKYEGNELSLYEGGEVREFGGVQVKGRGNVTWMQEKKPYQIKFGSKVDLFGMGKAKKWVLLANAMDASYLRNDVAFELARMLEMEYVFDGEFVELYFDGEYEGLYYLTHAVEIGKTTVNLKDPMGVLVELDNLYWNMEESYLAENGDYLVIKDIVAKEKKMAAMEGFLIEYNKLVEAISQKDYEEITSIIDVESFAKYYLLNEFLVNPDAYWTSFYFYKDGVDDRIHAGPGWDFDLSLANRRWGNWMGESFYSPTQTMVRKRELLPKEFYDEAGIEGGYRASVQISRIMYNLMDVPEFREEVIRVYNSKMSGRMSELIVFFQKKADDIESLVQYDNKRWGGDGYWNEIEKMVDWIGKRYEFFETEYSGRTEVVDVISD